jgi:hypothetical protein
MAIYRNQKQATYKKICESHINVTFKRTGIRAYKGWPCATGDSVTYFVAVETPKVGENQKIVRVGLEGIRSATCSVEAQLGTLGSGCWFMFVPK